MSHSLHLSPAQRELLSRLQAEEGLGQSELARIKARTRTGDLPLSFSQERLWFLSQLEPDSPSYNIAASRRFRGPLDRQTLERTLSEVLRRHEVLRTTFATVAGVPRQVIAEPQPARIPLIDLSALPGRDRDAEARRLAHDHSQRPFNLATGPILRAVLIQLADADRVVLFAMHHIASDAWSMNILMQEIGAVYSALLRGQRSPLEDLAIQYADFAVWQRASMQGEVLSEHLNYWKGQLGGDLPILNLPADRPRASMPSLRGAVESRQIPADLSLALTELSRREGATLFMTVLAAFQIILSRWTGQEDIAVGVPIAGRNRPETEGLIGYFVNTLVLRCGLRNGPSFRELLARVRATALEAYAHQDLPFEKLVEELQPERDLARQPLFQVMFNFANVRESRLDVPGLTLERFADVDPIANYDLQLDVTEADGRIHLSMLYATDLFDGPRIAQMMDQLALLLAEVREQPARRIGQYSLRTSEADVVLPNPRSPLPADDCGTIPALFARAAREHGDRPAVVQDGQTWTYSQVDQYSNQFAHCLQAAGIGKGDVVAVYGRRRAPLIWALLGTLKAGAAFTILDSAHPAARHAACLELLNPKAWVEIDGPAELPDELGTVIDSRPWRLRMAATGDPSRDALAAYPPVACEAETSQDDLAYVAFTSGSTGVPQAVAGRHRAVSHFLGWQAGTFGLMAADRFAMLSGIGHDPLLRDVFAPLAIGAALYVPYPDFLDSPAGLLRWLESERITAIHVTPPMARLLADAAQDAAPKDRRLVLSSLRNVFFGGDVLLAAEARAIRALAPLARCINFYGATETPQAMGWWEVDGASGQHAHRPQPLGAGIPGVQLLVINSAGELAGFSEAGEICVRTPYLAQGYVGNDALTQERFQVNPFTGAAGDRVYCTGDIGRYLPGGELEYLGRADNQVKIRGFRVELGEVEAALRGHEAVRDVVVVAREHQQAGRQLVAYVVGGAEPAELNASLRQKLPDYMMPAAIVAIAALPLTPNGKVDRAALPDPDVAAGQNYEPPLTPVEQGLAGIWGDLLGISRVGRRDNFFEVGGHSLLAMQLLSRVRSVFRVDLPLREVFDQPTLKALAGVVRQLIEKGATAAAPPLAPAARDRDLPLSFAQQRLWFIDQLEPGTSAYNIPAAVRLRGDLDPAVLEHCLTEVMRRHENLRTVFRTSDGVPRQVVTESVQARIPVVDLQALGTGAAAEIERLARAEAERPFDLSAGPLVRATLLRAAPRDHVVLLTMHHIVSDGWSMGILIREISELYTAFRARRASSLKNLPVQYADFAIWQREWLRGDVLQRQLAYWKRQLGGELVTLDLPADRPRSQMHSASGAEHYLEIPAGVTQALRDLGRREGVTLFMTLLAALQTLLSRYTGQQDIRVGTPVSGRSRSEIEGLIGLFVNTLVLRCDLSGNPDFRQLLARIRDAALGAYAHSELPFEQLVHELQPERATGHQPLFQVMLALQNAPSASLDLPGLELAPLPVPPRRAIFDLTLTVEETNRGLLCVFNYNQDLFDSIRIERMAGHFGRLLAAVAAGADRPLWALPLLSEAESLQLRQGWAGKAVSRPVTCVQEIFENQAERTPDADAVIFEDERLSYTELNRRANQLGHELQARGVGREVPVALCLERGFDMVVAVLAVLKAGGAYVPLDPAYPCDRLAFMIEDAKPAVLLTQSSLRPQFPDLAVPILCVDHERSAIARRPVENPVRRTVADNLAYIIYTSGSTGRPKGVALPHGVLVNLIFWHLESIPNAARTLQFASWSFDASFHEAFAAWGAGGSLVLASEVCRKDIGALAGLLRSERVQKAVLPVAVLQHLAEEAVQEPLPDLQLLVTTGEQLRITGPIVEFFQQTVSCPLHNHYGPSETHVVTAYELAADPATWSAHPPIGRPITNCGIYLLDSHLELAPAGVRGELYIGGDVLARGYLGRPELTAERFIPNPYSAQPGARMYRTGDIARYLADGTIEFLGRADHQLKIRGFRIEPAEIESVLTQHAAVAEVVVQARPDATGALQLAAWVTERPEQSVSSAELRNYLRGRLPEHMVPTAIFVVDGFPLTPNGKIDTAALPIESEPRDRNSLASPRDVVELRLARIWGDVLGVTPIGMDDNFFDLGGHSFLAVRLLSRIRKEFGRQFPVTALLQAPTVEDFAALVRHELPSSGPSCLVPIQPAGSRPPFFCVHAIDGGVLIYLDLARELGNDQPFFALQAPGFEGEAEPIESLTELAEHYIDAIRTVQSSGPYLLGGWSSGGLIAFEMARKLQERGEQAGLIALFDTGGPGHYAREGIEETDIEIIQAAFGGELDLTPQRLRGYSKDRHLPLALDLAKRDGLVPPDYTLAQIQGRLRVFRALRRAGYNYQPLPYPGVVDMFRCTVQGRLASAAPAKGWDEVAAEVRIHPVPSSHRHLLTEPESVKVIAGFLSARIQESITQGPPKSLQRLFRRATRALS